MIILILLFIVIQIFLYYLKDKNSFAETFIHSIVLLFFEIYITTEFLNIFSKVNSKNVFLIHSIIAAILLFITFLVARKSKKKNLSLSKIIIIFFKYLKKNKLLFLIIILLIFLFISGVIFPPNNWDAMTYHLARVGYWIQNQSVEFFPTYNERQLFLGPLSEYSNLHIILLNKSDKFVFLTQFISAIGSIMTISLLAKKIFNLDSNKQVLAAFIGLVIPMGLLQSISTQSDYVSSFFVLTALYFFLKKDNIFFFIAAALGFLTKQSTVFFLFPITFFWIIETIKFSRINEFFYYTFILISIDFLHLYRNIKWFGSILGPTSNDYIIGSSSPALMFINFIKNLSVNLQSPFRFINLFLVNIVITISELFSVDINNQAITYNGSIYEITNNIFDHDYAGNSLHILLIFLALFLFRLKIKSKIQKKYIKILLIGSIATFTILKWQPWATRLHLTSLLLFTPLIAALISKYKVFTKFLIIVMFIFSIFIIGFNFTRTLFKFSQFENQESSRYIKNPYLSDDFIGITDYIIKVYSDDYVQIGIISNGNSWEYPIWYYLYQSGINFKYMPFFIHQIHDDFIPNIIIDLYKSKNLSEEFIYKEYSYKKILLNKFIDIDVWERL